MQKHAFMVKSLTLFKAAILARCFEKKTSKIVGNKAKVWISNRVFQENKVGQIFRKTNIYTFLTTLYQRVKNVRFSENLTCFVFLKHTFWDSTFCLITNKIILLSRYIFTALRVVISRRNGLNFFFQIIIKKNGLSSTRKWDNINCFRNL